jgi:hypothetical protein
VNSPCEKHEIIEEIRDDVKELVRVKNILLGVYTASRVIFISIVGFIGWLIGTITK